MSTELPTLEMTRRMLVIDDSASCRALVRAQLAGENIELFEAADGLDGLAAARELRPDLILLDLTLPTWDGFETLKRLKEVSETRSIPVIFVSASASNAEKASGLDLGAVDFVLKPFDPLELRARVRAALRSKYMQDLLEQRAHLDGLTGLGNRHALEERLDAEWQICRRRSSPLAVLIADLDHFKQVNDRHGHFAGDEVLRRAARVLRDSVRGGDFVARYGGEEFVVVAPDCDREGGLTMAERFRSDVADLRITSYKSRINVTASVGVTATTPQGESTSPSDLLGRADEALYRAKTAGRNLVYCWDDGQGCPVPGGARQVELAPAAAGE
jgi:diguanylate cyclase (GGDEF)-like protein